MKQKQCKTSSIIIDLKNSLFEKLIDESVIYSFDLPSFFKERPSDFAMLHNWAKDSLNLPYYLNFSSKKIYVLVSIKEKEPELSFEGKKLSSNLFSDFYTEKNIHITLKLLLAMFFENSENFVSNDKLFLYAFVNKANSWATVLKIDLTHNYKNKTQIEFSIKDSANRLKKISLTEYIKYYSRETVYGKSYRHGHLFFKQLKRSEINSYENNLFTEQTFRNTYADRAKINFHSIMDASGHESSKAFLLERFSGRFLKYLNEYGIKANAKELNLNKVEMGNTKNGLDIRDFSISLVDGRKVKKRKLSEFFLSNDEIIFAEKEITDLKQSDSCLFVMDYNKEDFGERFKGERDPYKSFKQSLNHRHISKQGICVNENYFDDDADGLSIVEYLNYKGLEGEDWERNLGISISQLFLKNILLNGNASLLPFSKILKSHCFCFRNYLLFVEDQKLMIAKFDSPKEILSKVVSMFQGLNVDQIFETIYNYHNPYPTSKDFDFLTHKFVFGEDGVIEIIDIPERAFYDETEIKKRIAERNKSRPKTEFKSKNSDLLSEQFNSFIDESVDDFFLSYEELKAKYGKGETGFLQTIFNAKNESPLLKFLTDNTDLQIKGIKQGGIFSTYSGVWFDKEQQQYFVGRTHGYQHKQEKGSQMKKVVTHFGTFDDQAFFNLLNVDFIRYKEITVNPFPFKLIEMYDTIKSDTSNKIES